MADTTFTNGVTVTDADWFNDLNRLHYTIFSDPADLTAVKTSVLASPVAIGSGTPAAGTFTNLTATGNASVTGTLGVTGAATLPTVSGVTTFANQPVMSSLTASRAVFTDGSKGLVSNAITGTGNVVMSASPTLTGTIAAAGATLSGNLTLSGLTSGQLPLVSTGGLITSSANYTFTDAGGVRDLVVKSTSATSASIKVQNTSGNSARVSAENPGIGQAALNYDSVSGAVVEIADQSSIWYLTTLEGYDYLSINQGGSSASADLVKVLPEGIVQTLASTTITSAGHTALLIGDSATFGVYAGSGVPTLSAGKGSLYLRTDGTTTNNRMYVNTNGTTGWTAITTAT